MFCPKKKGFFPFVHQQVRDSLSREEWTAFCALRTSEERLKFVLSLPRLRPSHRGNLFRVVRPLHGEKSRKRSEEAREVDLADTTEKFSDCCFVCWRGKGKVGVSLEVEGNSTLI